MGDDASTSAAIYKTADDLDEVSIMGDLEEEESEEEMDEENLDKPEEEFSKQFSGDVMNHNGLWMEYVTGALSGQHQEGLFLAPYQPMAITSLKWHLVAPLQVLITKRNNCRDPTRNGIPYHAVQVVKFNIDDSQKLDVQCLCAKSTGRIFQLKHDEIVSKRSDLKGMMGQLFDEIEAKLDWLPKSLIYPLDCWEKLRRSFNESAFQLIDKGMILEMQLEEDPRVVTIAEVVENNRGFLKVKYGRDYVRFIHMTSPFIHEIGWVRRNESAEFQLIPGRSDDQQKRQEVPVSTVWKNGFIKNKMHQNELVVFLDHDRRNFYFAHVDLIPNSAYFFHLFVGKQRVKHPKTKKPMFFHMSHDHLFSYKILRSARIKVQLPRNFTKPATDTRDYADLCVVYQQYFIRGTTMLGVECIGAHSDYNLLWKDLDSDRKNMMIRNMTSLKFVEILLPDEFGLVKLHAAKVLKAHFFLLILAVAGREGAVYAHPYDRSVFQFGTAKDWSETIRRIER